VNKGIDTWQVTQDETVIFCLLLRKCSDSADGATHQNLKQRNIEAFFRLFYVSVAVPLGIWNLLAAF
jgi:hypothetical protein